MTQHYEEDRRQTLAERLLETFLEAFAVGLGITMAFHVYGALFMDITE